MTGYGRTLLFLLAALIIIGWIAQAPVVSRGSKCACATELEALEKRINVQLNIAKGRRAELHAEHSTICRIKHGSKDHEIRTRRDSEVPPIEGEIHVGPRPPNHEWGVGPCYDPEEDCP